MEVTAVIPARIGSKGVPKKNLKEVQGVPLVGRAVIAASESKYVNRIIVTTDDPQVSKVAAKYGLIEHFDRNPEYATDTAGLKPVVAEIAPDLSAITAVLLPAYPFRTGEDLDKHIEFFRDYPTADSCLIGVPIDQHPFVTCIAAAGSKGKPVGERFEYRRQDRPDVFGICHWLIALKTHQLEKLDDGFWNETTVFRRIPKRPIDIDTQYDMNRANVKGAIWP